MPTFELVNIHILNFVSFNLIEAGGYRQGGLGRWTIGAIIAALLPLSVDRTVLWKKR